MENGNTIIQDAKKSRLRRLRSFRVGLFRSSTTRNKKPNRKSIANNNNANNGNEPNQALKSRLHSLHPAISHFLGYRLNPVYASKFPFHTESSPDQHGPLQPLLHWLHISHSVEVLIWSFVGSFVGLALVQLLFTKAAVFNGTENEKHWSAPPILGSFGASAVLVYGAIEGPLSQPRSFVGGQFISALSGIIFAKLFSIDSSTLIQVPQDSFASEGNDDHEGPLVWLCSSLAAAVAIVAMFLTSTVHPPGGATALLATTNGPFKRLGWKLLPIVLLSSMIMLVWSLIWNNLGRRKYPTFWWHPKFPFDPINYIPRRNKNKNLITSSSGAITTATSSTSNNPHNSNLAPSEEKSHNTPNMKQPEKLV